MVKNLNKINELKAEKVKKIVSYIEEQNKKEYIINKVIIFGSSVRHDCREDSDIDICLFITVDTSNFMLFTTYGNIPIIADNACDILIYHKLGDKLKNEIDKEGIEVYEYKTD